MPEGVDGRRLRGDRTRRRAARAAADLATLDGFDAVSITRVAQSTGSSASGILTVFDNRESVHLAAVAYAREQFVAEVITPAWVRRPGVPRLSQIIDNWFAYVANRRVTGGCFMIAATMDLGVKQGPVADAVREMRSQWLTLIEGELRVDRQPSKAADDVVAATVFRLDAYLVAADLRLRSTGDARSLATGQRACRRLLADVERDGPPPR